MTAGRSMSCDRGGGLLPGATCGHCYRRNHGRCRGYAWVWIDGRYVNRECWCRASGGCAAAGVEDVQLPQSESEQR